MGQVTVNTNNNPLRKIAATISEDVRNVVLKVKTAIAKNTGELSHDDLTTGIANSRYLLFNYLLDNNQNSVATIVKNNLGENIDFNPSRQQLETLIGGYIEKGSYGKLQTILDNFVYNPNAGNYTSDPEVVSLLTSKLNK